MTTRQFDELIDDILDERNDRSLIILCSSIIDEQLFNILKTFLKEPVKIEEDLLKGDNPLATFSSRIKIIHRLGIIDISLKDILDNVRKVRNLCAHSVELNVNKSPIRDHILSMKKQICNRETYKLTKNRFFENSVETNQEIKAMFVTICVILEAINNSIEEIKNNEKTTKISTR